MDLTTPTFADQTSASQRNQTTLNASDLLFENQILTVREAAKLLRISVRTLQKRVSQRTVPFKRIGKCVRFSRDQLLGWIAKGD